MMLISNVISYSQVICWFNYTRNDNLYRVTLPENRDFDWITYQSDSVWLISRSQMWYFPVIIGSFVSNIKTPAIDLSLEYEIKGNVLCFVMPEATIVSQVLMACFESTTSHLLEECPKSHVNEIPRGIKTSGCVWVYNVLMCYRFIARDPETSSYELGNTMRTWS